MVGRHHQHNGHEFEQTSRESKGQGNLTLVCNSPLGGKESDMTGKPTLDFPGGSVVKNAATHAGNMGSAPELGRSPGDKCGNAYLPGKSH